MDLSIRRIDWEEWVITIALVPACAYFLLVDFHAGGWSGAPWLLFHSLDLIVHEAGHFFFRFFGETMMIAGGSLLQILLPAIVAVERALVGLARWLPTRDVLAGPEPGRCLGLRL